MYEIGDLGCESPKNGSLMSPESDTSWLSASTVVDINSGQPYIGETLADTIGFDESSWTSQATPNGEYATYTDGLHSMPCVSSLGFPSMETSFFSQGFESGLVAEPQCQTFAINSLQFGGEHPYAQEDNMASIEFSMDPQATLTPLSMDGMLIGPWTN
jgi:hypothetical protein